MSLISTLLDRTGIKKASPQAPKLSFNQNDPDPLSKGTYNVIANNWFTARPYGFTATNRKGAAVTMFLPISPSNLTINTSFATNMIATLYGTVEEHSPVRYYDIVIEGTTGLVPKYVSTNQFIPNAGRASFQVSEGLSNIAGGFFAKTLALVDQISNKASELINGVPPVETGVTVDQTGYLAFHNLYRFLLQYKKDAAGVDGSTAVRHQHPLTFFNYKDNNQYDVVVRNFTLKRTAENPMLYYYSITLRGYNLRPAGDKPQGIDQTANRLKLLGLDGVDSSSLLGNIKGAANKVKSILGPLGAGINILGR